VCPVIWRGRGTVCIVKVEGRRIMEFTRHHGGALLCFFLESRMVIFGDGESCLALLGEGGTGGQ
jgi:hypothetical protein